MALLKWSIDRTDAILDSLASSASESDPEAMHITELPPGLVGRIRAERSEPNHAMASGFLWRKSGLKCL